MSRIGNKQSSEVRIRKKICTLCPVPCTLEKGFTLIEIMITITILAVGIVWVLRAYTTEITAFEVSQSSINMLCLLKEEIADIEKDVIQKKELLPGTYGGGFEADHNILRWESNVRVLDFGSEEMKDCLSGAVLTVYDDHIKPPKSFSLATYVESNVPNRK